MFCSQETSQFTSTRLLSFVTGRGESKSCSRENALYMQNIYDIHTRIIKIQMLNCYCQLSSSVIFRQIVLANQNAKLTGPDQGSLVSPLVLTRKPWERGWSQNGCRQRKKVASRGKFASGKPA